MRPFILIFWAAFMLAISWPVLPFVLSISNPPRLLWVLGWPLQYAWVLLWAFAALVVLVVMAFTVARRLQQNVLPMEHDEWNH